jgi:hypothetical protein
MSTKTQHVDLLKQAAQAEREHRWRDASAIYVQIAHGQVNEREYEGAAEYFMRAAASGERAEDWRRLGIIWLNCANAVESRPLGDVIDVEDEADQSKHYFPTLDHSAWEKFSWKEKLGRAYRNAAYHLEKAGANQSAYDQYRKSGDVFRDGGLFDQATRSYYHALVSFAEHHGEIDLDTLASYRMVAKELISQDRYHFLKRVQIHYRGVAGKLTQKGNGADASELFKLEADISRQIALQDKRIIRWGVLTLWKLTSGYGTSAPLWGFWAVVLFGMFFPIMFSIPGVLIWQELARKPIWVDYVYFSVSTLVAGNDPSFALGVSAKCISLFESGFGLVMVSSFLSLFSKKFVR